MGKERLAHRKFSSAIETIGNAAEYFNEDPTLNGIIIAANSVGLAAEISIRGVTHPLNLLFTVAAITGVRNLIKAYNHSKA